MSTPRGGNAPLKLHQRCELTSYGRGEILFVGQTSFSPGLWVGIALDEAIGKHDGVVQGKRYFSATQGHGIFVRSSQLRVIDHDEDVEHADEETYRLEDEVTPSPAITSRRTSATSSRTPSRLAPSPAKQTSSRPASNMPPPSASSGIAASRLKTGSPVRPNTTASRMSLNRSPIKTPAGSAPLSRVGTASGRASVASRPASNLGRPSTTSPLARTPISRPANSSKTPATATLPPTAARKAVQAAKAPDASTARAGLRPVLKARPSMAPPSSARQSPIKASQTPIALTSRRSGAATTSVGARLAEAPHTVTSLIPGDARSYTSASISTSRRGSALEDDDEEDLLTNEFDDEGLDQDLHSSSDDDLDEHTTLANQQEEGLVSPSLRKSAATIRPDYMSLSSGPSITALGRNTGEIVAMQRELDELRVKLRTAEKKREEDRERLREAERIQIDSEQFLAVRPKMQAKQQELQDQIKEMHKMEKEWLSQKEQLEKQLEEANFHLESTALDRELAEEGKESVSEQLNEMKHKVEMLEIEVETLQEQNALYEQGPVDDKDKLSIGYIQMEKQNERLKDALIRLRDVMEESEIKHKKQLEEQKRELEMLDDLQASYESVCSKLETSDALLEDLKIQLDDALGAEEMLEQLTERNMALSDQLEGLKMTVEDLEALKELSDELEETHIETEKQLQEEIDLKDLHLRGYQMRIDTLEANVVDYEGTFAQFRELVMNLQSELEAARNDDTKAQDTSRAEEDQAMLNLNLKLQSSTLKSQAKTIELELGKLQARQARENLDMISPYLPREYFDHDKDACDSLLFFQRVAAKTDLIKTIVEGNHDIAGSLVGVVDESLIKVCKMRHSLAHFVVFSRQISAVIRLSSIPTFLKAGRMYKELVSMERRIDHFIDQLRDESLNEDECGKEFNRFVKLLEDFDYALVDQANEGLYSDLSAKEVGSAILLDLDLDTISAALGFSKQSIASLFKEMLLQAAADSEETSSLGFSEKDINEGLFQPIQELINTIRATKVPARKLLRRLSNLYDNSEAVKMEAIVKLPGLGKLTSQLVEFSSILVNTFSTYSNEARINKSPIELKVLLFFVQEATSESFGQGGGETTWQVTQMESSRLSQTVGDLLGAATEQENVIKITGDLPWLSRVEEIRRMQSENHETQRIIAKQTDDLKDLYKQTKIRDELLQENYIKIERLGKQLQKSKEELNAVEALKSDLSDMTKRMKAYEEGNSALQGELEQLQREYERAIQEGATKGTSTKGEAGGDVDAAAGSTLSVSGYSRNAATISSSSLEISFLVDQLEALRGALKHYRTENNMLKSRDVLGKLELLPPLLTPATKIKEEDSLASNRGIPKPPKEMSSNESVTAEGRRLIKEFMTLASSPRVVTLSPQPTSNDANEKQRRGRQWKPLSMQPQNQYFEQLRQKSQIQQQIHSFHTRIGTNRVVTLQV